jgi:glycosyltransferase involved in cell wall biosynthesis
MERQMETLARGLAELDVHTTVVTLQNRTGLAEHECVSGYDIHRIAPGAGRWAACRPVFRQLGRLRDAYDLILVDGFRTLGMPAVLRGLMHHKLVVLRAENNGELSGAFFNAGLQRLGLTSRSLPVRPLNTARQALLGRADHFIAISASIKEEFLRQGIPAERITVIPNSVDVQRFRPPEITERSALRQRLGLPADAWIVCFTGRLVAWKGPLVLLRAWRALLDTLTADGEQPGRPRPLLLLLGAGGSDLESCEMEARRFREDACLGDSVRFLGDVGNVEELLRAADAFALPTANDSFAIAVAEAMATGLPVVTTQVAGLADYVVPDVNALVVPPNDARALRDALLRLRRDPALGPRIGAEAVRRIQRFSSTRIVARHLQLFRALARTADLRRSHVA